MNHPVQTLTGPNGPIAKMINAEDGHVDDVLLSRKGSERSVWRWCLFEDGSLALITMPLGALNMNLRKDPALAPLFEKPKVKLYCYAYNDGRGPLGCYAKNQALRDRNSARLHPDDLALNIERFLQPQRVK